MSYDFYYAKDEPQVRYAHKIAEEESYCLTSKNQAAWRLGDLKYAHCQTQEDYEKYQTVLQTYLTKQDEEQKAAVQQQESMRIITRRNRIIKAVVITLIALIALAAIAALILFAAPAIVAANGIFFAVFAVGVLSGVITTAAVSAIYQTCQHGLEWIVS
jgi:fatty acid desaturase